MGLAPSPLSYVSDSLAGRLYSLQTERNVIDQRGIEACLWVKHKV